MGFCTSMVRHSIPRCSSRSLVRGNTVDVTAPPSSHRTLAPFGSDGSTSIAASPSHAAGSTHGGFTTTAPPAKTANASLFDAPPGRSPKPIISSATVHQNASNPSASCPIPTTTSTELAFMNRQARSGAGKRKIVVRNLITQEENGPGQLTGGARPPRARRWSTSRTEASIEEKQTPPAGQCERRAS